MLITIYLNATISDTTIYTRHIISAKQSAINMVQKSEIIQNKEDLIDRIHKIGFIEYHTRNTDIHMFYRYDEKTKKEFIYVNRFYYDSVLVENQFIHEFAHMIYHSMDKIDIGNLRMKFDYEIYTSYFKDWRTSYVKRGKKMKEVKVGNKLATYIVRDRHYFLSQKEMFARMYSLYHFLYKNNILKQGENLDKRHIDSLSAFIKQKFPYDKEDEPDFKYKRMLMHDFIFILPLINWKNKDEMNRIFR